MSDAFDIRRQELIVQFNNPEHDYFLDPEDYDSDDEYHSEIAGELEIRDYYTEKTSSGCRSSPAGRPFQDNATLPPGTEFEIVNGKKHIYTFRSVGRLIDDALEAIEKDNPKLKGVLNRSYGDSEDRPVQAHRADKPSLRDSLYPRHP